MSFLIFAIVRIPSKNQVKPPVTKANIHTFMKECLDKDSLVAAVFKSNRTELQIFSNSSIVSSSACTIIFDFSLFSKAYKLTNSY